MEELTLQAIKNACLNGTKIPEGLHENYLFAGLRLAIEQTAKKPTPESQTNLERLLLELENPHFLVLYAHLVTHERWPEAEKIIIQESFFATQYAQRVIQGRWLELEKVLLIQDHSIGIIYARDVLGARWPELEELCLEKILDNPMYAFMYMKKVLKEPWGEAIELLENAKSPYLTDFIKEADILTMQTRRYLDSL
jgi:hypothetical protein